MSEITINAEIRKEVGKHLSALRQRGQIPGIYYGHGEKNITVSLPELVLRPLYKTSATHVITLKLDDGSTHTCILRDIQFDPVTDRPIHFDLFGLKADEELVIDVPVVLKGTPKGVKGGGLLQHVLHKIKVSCLPKNIPDHIELDIVDLDINTSIHVKDISVPNVTILDNENNTIVAVIPPTVVKEPVPAEVAVEGELPVEPEVISKGKKTEEEEDSE